MKRCPQCRLDYYDDTLSYCLEDGTPLVYGIPGDRRASEHEPMTAVLPARDAMETAIEVDAGPAEPSDLVPSRRPRRNRTDRVFLILGLLILFGGAGFGLYKWRSAPAVRPVSFQNAKFTRLTTTGKASGVAISPDGKWVVHVQDDGGQQSLWMRQVATHFSVQLLPPAAVIINGLAFSPDGNYVYYRVFSQANPHSTLFQLPTLGGTPKKLLDNVSVFPISFSPDGKQFVFSRPEPGKEFSLVIANADGTDERTLLTRKNPPEAIYAPAWSPDGKKIAYVLSDVERNDRTIFEVDVSDGSTRPVTEQRWLRISRIDWLSDGSGLLMVATPGQSFVFQIWHLSYADGTAQQLTNDLNNYQGLSLTSDAGTLAVVQSETRASIWAVPVEDVSRARAVTTGSEKADVCASWARDGRILYHSNAAGGNNNIWITDVDGGNPKQLTSDVRDNQCPVASPDGRYIVFLSDRSGTPHLWRMNMDGSDQRQFLNTAAGEQGAQFSPDGRWLLYRTPDGKTSVWKVPLQGGEPVLLSDKFAGGATVSPDGKMVAYYYRDENAPFRIAVAPLDGDAPTRTFEVPATTSSPILRWAPDSRAIVYSETKNGISNLLAQPLDGGPAKQLTDFKTDRIFSADYSADGKQLVLSRGTISNDVVLISNAK